MRIYTLDLYITSSNITTEILVLLLITVEKKIFWDDLKIARRIYQVRIIMSPSSCFRENLSQDDVFLLLLIKQGRAVDSISGEPLTIEQLKRVYEQKHGPPVLRVVPNISDDAEDKPTQLAE